MKSLCLSSWDTGIRGKRLREYTYDSARSHRGFWSRQASVFLNLISNCAVSVRSFLRQALNSLHSSHARCFTAFTAFGAVVDMIVDPKSTGSNLREDKYSLKTDIDC